MTTEALTTTAPASLVMRTEDVDRARQLIEDATPPNTIRARESALRYFWSWAEVALDLRESWPIKPDVLVRFVTDHLAGLAEDIDAQLHAMTWEDSRGRTQRIKAKLGPSSASTVSARVSHLSAAHKAQGLDSPATDPRVIELLKAGRKLRARNGGKAAKRAAPLATLNAMCATCDLSAAGKRDLALLLVAFASGGRRRSEVAGLAVEDLERVARQVHGHASSHAVDYVWTLRRSKTDQEGTGLALPIKGRAADALSRWLAHAEISEGPIFRKISKAGNVGARAITGRTVNRIVKRHADLAGLDPAEFGGHSMRSGFVTEAGLQGVALTEAMALSGHKTPAVAASYHQTGAVLHSKAASLVG